VTEERPPTHIQRPHQGLKPSAQVICASTTSSLHTPSMGKGVDALCPVSVSITPSLGKGVGAQGRRCSERVDARHRRQGFRSRRCTVGGSCTLYPARWMRPRQLRSYLLTDPIPNPKPIPSPKSRTLTLTRRVTKGGGGRGTVSKLKATYYLLTYNSHTLSLTFYLRLCCLLTPYTQASASDPDRGPARIFVSL